MATNTITVYHATKKGNGRKIEKKGWLVGENTRVGQVYGRGIYFWDLIEDAHTFGSIYLGNDYDIVSENIPLVDGHYTYYDHNKRNTSDPDVLAQGLLRQGIHCLIISRAYMDYSTMMAQGRAYVWLVDINKKTIEVNF
jgi:hypothetical protein